MWFNGSKEGENEEKGEMWFTGSKNGEMKSHMEAVHRDGDFNVKTWIKCGHLIHIRKLNDRLTGVDP